MATGLHPGFLGIKPIQLLQLVSSGQIKGATFQEGSHVQVTLAISLGVTLVSGA